MRQFMFDYYWDRATYTLIIPADTLHEAECRLEAIQRNATYKGEVMARIKVANSESGWWAKFVKFLLGVRP